MQVSETEKHGVSTSSRRLSNKVENIPIKKRRFLLRSPSPPLANPVNLTDNQGVSEKGVISDVNLSRVVDNNDKSDKPDENLGQNEDFCGISILAAAACSYEDGLKVKDESSVKDGSSILERVHESSTITEVLTSSKGLSKEDVLNSSEMSSGVTSSCKSTISSVVNSLQNDANVGKFTKVDSSAISDDFLSSKDEELAKNPSLSSRDERLHWDLNVVMDAWEQPFEELDPRNKFSRNVSEEHGKVDYCKKNRDDALTSQNVEKHDIDGGVKFEHFHEENVNPNDGLALTFNSNLTFDIVKSTIEKNTNTCHEESVNPIDGLSCTSIEAKGTSLKSLNLKGFKKNVDIPSCDLKNFDDTTNTRISLCVSSSSDTIIEQKSNVSKSENVEAPKILRHEGFDHVENVDRKMLEIREHSEFVIKDHGFPKKEILDSVPKRSCELQESYDSQYEDGELREPSFRALKENDRENVENVSKYKGASSTDRSDYQVSDNSQEVDKKSVTSGFVTTVFSDDQNVGCDDHDDMEHDESDRIKSSRSLEKTDLLPGKEPIEENNKSFQDMETRSGDDNERKDKIRSIEPRAFKRTLQSQVEGPIGRGDTSRDEQFKKMDNRFESSSMRSFERIRYTFPNQVRGRQSSRWDGSSNGHRGCRRHYSPILRGRRVLDDDCAGDRDDLRYVDSHQLSKNRVRTELDSCTDFDPRFKSDRKFSPNRIGRGFGRGRSFVCGPFGENRGGRGKYNGISSDEAFQSSLIYRRSLSRRERSLSPFGERGQSSISRSKSRSPIIWRRLGNGNGGGNTFLRHRSRSPNCRSETTRIQRPRSPNQQPGFGVEHTGGFRSISRNHGSPRRWNSVRKDEMGQLREIGYKQRTLTLDRSPNRISLRDDRVSVIDSSRKMKNDGYFRMIDRICDDVNRGVRYDENYDDRKKQYSLIRPTRRHYDDEINDNNFRDRDSSSFQDRELWGFDNSLGSDVPRRGRWVNPSFIYERNDGKFNKNSKQFGLDGMDSSRNLKSDQPKYVGRFSDISGTYRGSRYETYENRRKHYGATHIIEDTEKRLNGDENFEDISGRVKKGFDGRIGSLSTKFREDEEPIVCGPSEN